PAGVVKSHQEFELCFREPTAWCFQFECEAVAVVPEQQVARAGEHAHALELGAGDLVAALAVRAVQPDHVGLGAQAQMVTDGALDRGLGPMSATACAAHGRPRISASASLARVKFTMSENEPSVRFSRYMPGKRLSGTMAT